MYFYEASVWMCSLTIFAVLVVIATLLFPPKTRSGLLYTTSTTSTSIENYLNKPTAPSAIDSDSRPAAPTIATAQACITTTPHRNPEAGSSTTEPILLL